MSYLSLFMDPDSQTPMIKLVGEKIDADSTRNWE